VGLRTPHTGMALESSTLGAKLQEGKSYASNAMALGRAQAIEDASTRSKRTTPLHGRLEEILKKRPG
jgi:hypothetical protein